MPIRIAKTTIAEPLYIAPLLKDHDLMIVFVFYLMEARMSTIKIGKYRMTQSQMRFFKINVKKTLFIYR